MTMTTDNMTAEDLINLHGALNAAGAPVDGDFDDFGAAKVFNLGVFERIRALGSEHDKTYRKLTECRDGNHALIQDTKEASDLMTPILGSSHGWGLKERVSFMVSMVEAAKEKDAIRSVMIEEKNALIRAFQRRVEQLQSENDALKLTIRENIESRPAIYGKPLAPKMERNNT